jgi:PhnB protein
MQMNPYLLFNGNCEAAFKFYEQCLGGKITALSTYGTSPAAEHVPVEIHNQVIHARLEIGDLVLMGSDSPPENFKPPQGFYINLGIANPAEAERLFNALAEDGQVTMPFAQTFWAYRFGMVVDQFGIPWMINCEKAA